MMRKKLLNKDKFLFNEDERLPPLSAPSKASVQSRLFKKADNRPAYNPPSAVGRAKAVPTQDQFALSRNLKQLPSTNIPNYQNSFHSAEMADPVLEAVVARLKSGQFSSNANCGSREQGEGYPRPGQSSPCVCERPLKLLLCGECGMTFPGRLKISCSFHPHDIYLLDVGGCKGCRGSGQALIEYELPAGMEAGIKNKRIK